MIHGLSYNQLDQLSHYAWYGHFNTFWWTLMWLCTKDRSCFWSFLPWCVLCACACIVSFLFWHQYNWGASFCTPPSSIFQLALWIMVILNNNGKTNTQSHHLLSLNNSICSPTPLSTQCVNFDMLLPIVFFAPWIFDNPKTIDLTFVIMGWVLI